MVIHDQKTVFKSAIKKFPLKNTKLKTKLLKLAVEHYRKEILEEIGDVGVSLNLLEMAAKTNDKEIMDNMLKREASQASGNSKVGEKGEKNGLKMNLETVFIEAARAENRVALKSLVKKNKTDGVSAALKLLESGEVACLITMLSTIDLGSFELLKAIVKMESSVAEELIYG